MTLFRVKEEEVCVLSASCLMDTITFDVLIEATEDTEVLVLPAAILNQVVQKNPYMELFLYKSATEKFSDVMWTMQQILFLKIDQRVAQFLWDEMIQKSNMTLSLTHDEIARYIGSAREVVTKVLKYAPKWKPGNTFSASSASTARKRNPWRFIAEGTRVATSKMLRIWSARTSNEGS